MPTLEYKIRKLAEILEEQGVYLDDITLSDETWKKWLDEHNSVAPCAWYIHLGDRKIRVNRRGANDYAPPPGGSLPHPNAPGQPPMPVPAITPQVPMTPLPLQQGWSDLKQHQRHLERQHLGGWPEGSPQQQLPSSGSQDA